MKYLYHNTLNILFITYSNFSKLSSNNQTVLSISIDKDVLPRAKLETLVTPASLSFALASYIMAPLPIVIYL